MLTVMAEIGNYDVTSRLPYKLMLSCPSGLLPSQVSVTFDKLYDRIPHPDFDLEKSIDQIWDQRAQQNSSLYNGKKFRYGGHAFHSTGGVECKSDCYLNLHLGLTDYRTFMGTNLNPLWEKFLVQSEDETVRCQHTSNPLGNGGIVATSDGKILVLKRSNNVGEFPGHFVFPGGHPELLVDRRMNYRNFYEMFVALIFSGHECNMTFKEYIIKVLRGKSCRVVDVLDNNPATKLLINSQPEEVGIISHDNLDPESLCRRVSLEMFDSIVREVVEETGVPAISLSNPVFIGISRRELNVRPTAFFFMKCSLQSKEIEKFYGSAQDGFESTQLCAVSKDELESLASKMPGCHHGGLALYKLMEKAKQN